MAVSWTPHRFSGGALALDVTNTVVLRGDPLGFDRFADIAELPRFAAVASRQRTEELGGKALVVEEPEIIAPVVLSVRETTDSLFRAHALEGSMESRRLASLLAACAEGLAGPSIKLWNRGEATEKRVAMPFQAALAMSALSLLPEARASRIRICANCRWLFLDESRNRSRIWCDMAVCGNRNKAKRHYERRRLDREDLHA